MPTETALDVFNLLSKDIEIASNTSEGQIHVENAGDRPPAELNKKLTTQISARHNRLYIHYTTSSDA